MPNIQNETDSLGVVELPAGKFWGYQTQRPFQIKRCHSCHVGYGSAADRV
jgi:fumarate hydratase class II